MHRYRMNRATYWFCFVAVAVFLGMLAYAGSKHGELEAAMLLVAVPRLHDIGRSGWFVVGVIAFEFIGLFGLVLAGADMETILTTAGALVFVILALGVWLGTIPGESGANKWGDPPRPGLHFGKTKEQS